MYEASRADDALLPVLEPGEMVDGDRVGEITAAAVDGDELLVSDGANLYRLEQGGGWAAANLAEADAAAGWSATAAGAFKGNYYLLQPDARQIAKFSAKDLGSEPTDWLSKPDASLAGAVDMVIDGRISVLLADGTLTTYYQGNIVADASLAAKGDGGRFVGLALASDGGFYGLEVVPDGATLVRLDAEGAIARYAPPTGWHDGADPTTGRAMERAVDFTVDAQRGVVYFVTADGLWRATLPAG